MLEFGYDDPEQAYPLDRAEVVYRGHSVDELWRRLSRYPAIPRFINLFNDRVDIKEVAPEVTIVIEETRPVGAEEIDGIQPVVVPIHSRIYQRGSEDQKRSTVLPLITELTPWGNFQTLNILELLRDRELGGRRSSRLVGGRRQATDWRPKFDAINQSEFADKPFHANYFVHWSSLSESEPDSMSSYTSSEG